MARTAADSASYAENKEINPLPTNGISPEVTKASSDANGAKTPSDSATGELLPVSRK